MGKDAPRNVLLLQAEGEPLAAVLEEKGVLVTVAHDERDAAELLCKISFDICVVQARAIDSSAFVASLRATARGAVTPVLVIGGTQTTVSDRGAALAAGADSFMDETASLESVADMVRTLVGIEEEIVEDGNSSSESGAVAEALAIAASMASPAHEHQVASGHEEPFVPVGTSLRQFIDQVEQRLQAPSEMPVEQAIDAADDFDVLELVANPVRAARVSEAPEAEARPEMGVEAPVNDEVEVERREATSVVDADDAIRLTTGTKNRGSLSDDPVWTLLATTYAAKSTGAVVLEREDQERRIYVDQGEPMVATSTVLEDRLVELLLREGRLSDAEYRNASEKVGASGRRAGAILVEHGIIMARELFPLVRHQYETIIFDSFGWREGTWCWDPSARPLGERILLDLPAPVLILEGIRSRTSPEDVERLIPAGSSPVGGAEGVCALRDVDLLPEELEIIEACDGLTTTTELAARFAMPERDLCALLAGMSVLGLVTRSDASRGARALPVERKAGHADDQQLARARLADKLSQVEDGSYFEILGIAPEASGYEIRKAYRVLHAQFSPERFTRLPRIEEVERKLSLVRAVVDEAYEVLRDPAMRESYRQALAREL
ncbi:MAG: DUF4388 domain-containing protein [Deltaproteobacteria bacterium]|nr:DUF4388 domain-containing protein [Deltaproteobacteria bacterium]